MRRKLTEMYLLWYSLMFFPIDYILQVLLGLPCHELGESKAWDMLLLLATSGP